MLYGYMLDLITPTFINEEPDAPLVFSFLLWILKILDYILPLIMGRP